MQVVQGIVEEKLVRYFLEPHPLDFPTCYKDSAPNILVMGSDPMSDLQRLAGEYDMLETIEFISLGQEQGSEAIIGIKKCGQSEKWVFLQNCHLAPSFMATLESHVGKLNPEECNLMFHLWLIVCPSLTFPTSILQVGVEMTIESPKGLKRVLLRSHSAIDEEWFQSSSKPAEFEKMHFGLCFFHGLILKPQSFGSMGWNMASRNWTVTYPSSK